MIFKANIKEVPGFSNVDAGIFTPRILDFFHLNLFLCVILVLMRYDPEK